MFLEELFKKAKKENIRGMDTDTRIALADLLPVAAKFSPKRKFCRNREEDNFFLRENSTPTGNNGNSG
jgi:hypothetical protein